MAYLCETPDGGGCAQWVLVAGPDTLDALGVSPEAVTFVFSAVMQPALQLLLAGLVLRFILKMVESL